MKRSYYMYNNGELHRKDNTLQFTNSQNETRDIPIEQVEDIYIMSEITLNTKFITFASKYKIPIHFFNYYSFYTGTFYPREELLSGNLLVKQVNHYEDEEKRICIARKFIDAAAANIYRNLRYYNGRGKNVEKVMIEIEALRKKILNTGNINELMGIEGNIRKQYYSAWNTIVDQKIDFEKRVKNPPDNMINTMISFVNGLVYTRVLGEIYRTQLNPTISYLHEPGVRRFSLSLDLAEVFKPILGDRLIFSLLNKNQITPSCFTKELNYLHLTKDASRTISMKFDEMLKTSIHHKELDKDVSYKHLIRLECYKLIKHIMGEKEYEGFKIWW
ncbi:type I-B CRISPR-associated endonuclease Cas1b [Clostridium saccharoperbutylacetonicum]|uniref:type I-B CRISPR-associated endonuclease Cas1b n=1 Tax=Clostridium saccharoperbutylacetonicum TaxID=36745 RepID=UPI000983901F|nr:type I-B CRISPR-associated endonuclease Cas1b [Clostridium saccharoperbutylacetonicum]AQR96102.1 CRISPR-associated endonuclease Cas1 [Clostridium saccharoperbutylacetonicum]NSB31971.1 CRISPR-associated protein Cas1 [Clostridium saccharoperbutylacetonicum]